ncbi:MAG: biopolymer transporter ExbD [Candidatus Babeliales bacterium]|jgi:biopolymer transport protein TolR
MLSYNNILGDNMQYRRYRSRKRKRVMLTEISLTPLIDTALTLLIIFMITTPMMQNSIRVDLPKGQAKETNDMQQELIVYVKKDGTLFFNEQAVEIGELIKQVKNVIGSNQEKTIFVKADQAVSYGTVIELVDQIKIVGGVKYVALATKKSTQATTAMG